MLCDGGVHVRETTIQSLVRQRRAWAARRMSFGMEAINAPIFDFDEGLLALELLGACAHSVIDDAVDVGALVQHLQQDLLGDRVVFRVFHVGNGEDETSAGIEGHEPTILPLLRSRVRTWSASVSGRRA